MIKYIGYYDDKLSYEQRDIVPSAITKMNYIISLLREKEIVIISASPTMKNGVVKGSYSQIRNNVYLKKFYSKKSDKFKSLSRVVNAFFRSITRLLFFIYLLKNVKRRETLIVYHSKLYSFVFVFLYLIKQVNIVLELEEIYSNVDRMNWFQKYLESVLINISHSYILSTPTLKKSLNPSKKSIVIYGAYQVENKIVKKADKFSSYDGRIHLVYAGTMDFNKGGAINSVHLAKKLNTDYVIHLLGFGKEKDIQNIKLEIEKLNVSNRVVYEGLKSGEEYKMFLQKCDIGLNLQNQNQKYSETSFPSKILIYLANGLPVVATPLSVFQDESLNKGIFPIDLEIESNDITKFFEEINNLDTNTMEIVKKLHKDIQKEFQTFLYQIGEE